MHAEHVALAEERVQVHQPHAGHLVGAGAAPGGDHVHPERLRHARDAEGVVARIAADLRPGGIALWHEGRRDAAGGALNVRPLEGLLAVLDRRGWRAVIPEERSWGGLPVDGPMVI